MKLDIHSIRFRFWLICFLLAVGITLFIGLLQIGLISPYYRNTKIRAVSQVADVITEDLIIEDTDEKIADALKVTVNNDVCVQMYNDDGRIVYSTDSLGNGCIFHSSSFQESEIFSSIDSIKETLNFNNGEYSTQFTNQTTGQNMIIYCRRIQENLGNYYLLVNSPLEPVDSTVTFFMRQYAVYTLLAIIIASLVAIAISNQLTRPIVTMKKEAQKLSEADYSASFEGGSFSETIELAQTLNDANEKLSRIDQMRRDLMANVSHDIRTPLTDIRAYAEMIRDISGDNPQKREKHLDVILKETDYMNRLITDMSELSRLQSGTYVLKRENVDLYKMIYEIVDLNRTLIENGQLSVHVNAEEDLTVYADETKIAQVISNYLSNAIKHTPAGKNIFIHAYKKDDEETVRLEVIDEGEGISEEELPYIWDRYQKSSHSFQRNMTSTGLGLSIVKAILDAHGATCGVQTAKDQGSTFWFELKETHEA